MRDDDETTITEITIAPDGRVYVFGTSNRVLEVLDELELGDPSVSQRLERLRSAAAGDPAESRKIAQSPANSTQTCHCQNDDHNGP